MKAIYLFLSAAICLNAESSTAQDKSNDTTARYFIIQASIGNLQEIAAGRVAVQKASAPEIKAFGQQMIVDHSKAEEQLMELVKTRGFQIPPQATDTPVANPMLQRVPSKDFDRIYVHMMVPDHGQTVQLFAKYAVTGKDPDVKEYARRMLPVLKEHLASITAIDKNLTSISSR
jgi:putative membrane protein